METLTLTQLVPAGRDAVRSAFLDVDVLARWWWPQWPDTTYALDPRPGGRYRIRTAAVGVGVHGEILTLGDGAAVLTWVWEDGDVDQPEETVTIQFTDAAGGTVVTVTHMCADPEPLRQGWTDVLARLAVTSGV